MQHNCKSKVVILVGIVGLFLLTACGEDEPPIDDDSASASESEPDSDSDSATSSDEETGSELVCQPGTTNACECGDGELGIRLCDEDGKGWKACVC